MELEGISDYIEKITLDEWQTLFALIPIIESMEVFSTGGGLVEDKDKPNHFIISQEFTVKVVYDFLEIMEELDLIIQFEWSRWDFGKEIFEKGEYTNLDTITLLKLLTAFIRADRFSYGAGLASRFEDRTIEKILRTIKNNIDKPN